MRVSDRATGLLTRSWACIAATGTLHHTHRRVQAARDYGALPDAEMVRMARSGEGAGRMPLSAEILESLLPKDESPQPSTVEQPGACVEHQTPECQT